MLFRLGFHLNPPAEFAKSEAVIASIVRFLKPTLLVIVCYLIAMGILFLSTRPNRKPPKSGIEEFSLQLDNVVQPDASLSVKDVIQIQLNGLSANDESTGILQCMTFASPGNRMVTGPLERFGRMVRSEEFAPLQSPDRIIIGKPELEAGIARALVYVVANRELHSYVWILSKQKEPPYTNCWMTDSVFAVDTSINNETSRPPVQVN